MLSVRQKGNGEGCDLILVCEEQGRQASIRCHSTQQVSMHRKIGRLPRRGVRYNGSRCCAGQRLHAASYRQCLPPRHAVSALRGQGRCRVWPVSAAV